MERILPVYIVMFGILLIAVTSIAQRGDASMSRKLAKVRVRVDEHRRQPPPEHPEDDFENLPVWGWFIFGAVLFTLFMLFSNL